MTETLTKPLTLTLADVQAAAGRIAGAVVRTPTMRSETLSRITGAEVYLKFENHQFTAAYKERGALNALLHLTPEQRAKGVIAASAGNHSQGLSYHGTRLGVPVTIVMPKTTPTVKIMQTEAVGGKVILEGESFDEAYAYARSMEAQLGLTLVPPFDDPLVAAGQGTVALEMLEDEPDLDILMVPVGGGGLISGVAVAAKGLKPAIKIIGVQTAEFPAFYTLMTGKKVDSRQVTLAEGIAVKEPGMFTRGVVLDVVDEIRIVSENFIEEAISLLLDIEKTVVEGAGAVGLAALLPTNDGTRKRTEFKGKKVGIILTGGNIDQRFLANVILRNLVRSGRIGRVSVLLDDRAGALSRIAQIFTDHNANIIEVTHQRIFGNLSAKSTQTDIEFEVRDRAARDRLFEALERAGYKFDVITLQGNKGQRFTRSNGD
ncbi:threonine ammonia-lyase [Alteraurantiacibacter buctensis]|uniref:Threonine ammonia-lyase n=1 Tax=Alteraurantiacibacter buctensis TaxID=1503981 RepID=A0A844YZW7_9SPHN|nr:threonine ammonia-lyase [Alteraurantiacibacter buctensis]MXO72762.1 threonine ammonia-lyase [Alteraurantiacibacter buctensis]